MSTARNKEFLRMIKEYLVSQRQAMVRVLKGLVERESPTNDKRAVDGCLDTFLSHVSKLPVDILRFPQGEIGDLCLVGYPGLSRFETKPVLVLAHTDTVWPVGQLKSMPWRTAGPRVYGPGVLDMKAGLVIGLFAMKALASLRIPSKRPVLFFVNSAEETGHPAANRMIEQLSRRSAFVLCLEPPLPGGALKVERKGRMVVSLRVRGKSAHAGTPQNGVSAVEELLGQLLRLRALRTKDTTMNIGLISGGTKANVVPAEAGAVLDLRFWKEGKAKVIRERIKRMKPKLPGARLSYSVESLTPPLERSAASRHLFRRAAGIASGLGLKLRAGRTGGGSDASLAASLGLPVLDGLGPDGAGIHAINEHILLPSFFDRTALLAALLAGLD